MVETYEDDLVEWYWNHQNENLTNWLCIERVLDPGEEGKKAMMFSFRFLTVIGLEIGGRLARDFERITKLRVRWIDYSLE